MYVAVDFDGTVVEHMYPEIGKPNPGAKEVLLDLVTQGHKIILFTMRSEDKLQEAVDYITKDLGVPLFGVNNNPTQKHWTSSPKAYAQAYIDDAALGCPLVASTVSDRPMVDWTQIRDILEGMGAIPHGR